VVVEGVDHNHHSLFEIYLVATRIAKWAGVRLVVGQCGGMGFFVRRRNDDSRLEALIWPSQLLVKVGSYKARRGILRWRSGQRLTIAS
jgi:hypothetical protein